MLENKLKSDQRQNSIQSVYFIYMKCCELLLDRFNWSDAWFQVNVFIFDTLFFANEIFVTCCSISVAFPIAFGLCVEFTVFFVLLWSANWKWSFNRLFCDSLCCQTDSFSGAFFCIFSVFVKLNSRFGLFFIAWMLENDCNEVITYFWKICVQFRNLNTL